MRGKRRKIIFFLYVGDGWKREQDANEIFVQIYHDFLDDVFENGKWMPSFSMMGVLLGFFGWQMEIRKKFR